jgi:hypothetical protein
MDRKHEKSVSTLNEKNDPRSVDQASKKVLTVEDLAAVVGGLISRSHYRTPLAEVTY